MMLLLGMNLQLKNELKISVEKIDLLEKSVQKKDEQIKELENFALGIATVQNRIIKETLKKPKIELLEDDRWKTDEDEQIWREFVDKQREDEPCDSQFTYLLHQNKLCVKKNYHSPFKHYLKRMLLNKFYYGADGRFFKVNVPSYINSLKVIYKHSLSEYFLKDSTMGLRSSKYLVSFSEGDCLNIVMADFLMDESYLIFNKEWKKKMKLSRSKPLVKDEFCEFVFQNCIMIYCPYTYDD